jgi:hypothetical protein
MSIRETPEATIAEKSTTTKTFRIDNDVIRLIMQKAEQDGITPL